MKVLGITGFEKSIPYLESLYPGRDVREYRISQGHDSAAALLIDGGYHIAQFAAFGLVLGLWPS